MQATPVNLLGQCPEWAGCTIYLKIAGFDIESASIYTSGNSDNKLHYSTTLFPLWENHLRVTVYE